MKKKRPHKWVLLCLTTFLALLAPAAHGAIVPPPWSDPQKNPCANLPGGWQLLYWPPLKKCFKIFQIGFPCPDTMELSPVGNTKFTKTGVAAECRCPPGTAMSAVSNRCQEIFQRGPCERGQYFSPLADRPSRKGANRWGTCKAPKNCPKGMLYWPRDAKCYSMYTKGPCAKGKLLVQDSDGLAQCKCDNVGELTEYYYGAEESCHEHYTKGPCQGHGHLFLPGGKCDCYPGLPHYNPENGQCYELGSPGPCPPGHVYSIPDNSTGEAQVAKCHCKEGYVPWSDGLCYRLYTRGPCEADEFLINSTTCIRNFCGKGRLYFPDQKSCYRIGSQGPCSLHQVVVFDFTTRPSIDGISYNGLCGCSGIITNLDQQCTNAHADPKENTCESSPGMVELEGHCYKLYTRGPCGPGQWLEPAKCQCRPGYTPYDSDSGLTGCYAPSVGLARYLNGQNSFQVYKFQFRRFMSLLGSS